jgi:hypothetical protein
MNIELNIHNIQVFHHLLIILIAVLSGPNQDLTYSSKRKMSQRQKKTRVHQGTQTEEIYFSDYGHMNGEGEYYDEHSTLYTRHSITTKSLQCLCAFIPQSTKQSSIHNIRNKSILWQN